MFTGLIKDIGTIKRITKNAEGAEIEIETKLTSDIQIDDSVATNGVCLTAIKISPTSFITQAVHVTLEKSNLGKLKVGSKVNLELALRPMDRLGGHFVQGHVNGVGMLKSIRPRGKNWELEFQAPENLFKYIIDEGSIAIDGISLTVAAVMQKSFVVSIIPHTFENTNLSQKKSGESVNIEVDMLAKYLENFVKNKDKSSNLLNLLD